jgi:hypothetical protein
MVEDEIRLFAMTNQLMDLELTSIEIRYAIDLQRGTNRASQADSAYYPQIESSIRSEAARMAPHYEVFYSLEKSIRALLKSTFETAEGASWWNSVRVPAGIGDPVRDRIQREKDLGVTLRSDDELDFCTFGELSGLILANWDIFSGMFSSKRAVERVMSQLNSLRGPIAHCSPLAEDEIVRLGLAVKDWFRLME